MEKEIHSIELDKVHAQADAIVWAESRVRTPVIGISANKKEGMSCLLEPYYQSVVAAGGSPIIIPSIDDVDTLANIIDAIDGLMLSGGGDIDPIFLGEKPIDQLDGIETTRDVSEFLLVRLARKRGLPIMGICRGHQVLNVALGGTIYQDIHTQFSANALKHSQTEPRNIATHEVRIATDPSLLHDLVKGRETLAVNSLHHQAVKEVAPNCITTAHATDGVNEGIELQEYPVFSVQWHPEQMAQDNEDMLNLFRVHVKQASTFAQAKKLHRQILTIDSHVDTPMLFAGEVDLTAQIGVYHGEVVDVAAGLPMMEAGRLDAVFMAAYIPQGDRTEHDTALATAYAIERLQQIHRQATLFPTRVGIARTPNEIRHLKLQGKKALVPCVENGYAIGQDLHNLQRFKELGVAYVTLCHNGNNDLCDSASGEKEWNGLSPLGQKVVQEMNRLGMMIDLSHAAESTFYDVINLSIMPVIASHSSVRALTDHSRNLYDDQLTALAKNGGVIQICLYKDFVNNIPEKATISDYVKHILYVIDKIGIDHVGVGSDFDGGGGVIGCRAANEWIQLTMRLIDNGLDEASIRKIWGENLLRVMQHVQHVES